MNFTLDHSPRVWLFLIVLASLVSGCAAKVSQEEKPPPAQVEVAAIQKTKTLEEWTELIGTTQPLPENAGRVTALVEGKVVSFGDGKTRIKEGQRVTQNQVIIQLDDSVLQANLARAVAAQKKLDLQTQLASN